MLLVIAGQCQRGPDKSASSQERQRYGELKVHVRRWDVKGRRAKTPKQTNRLVYNNHMHKLEHMFNSGLSQNAARVNDCCTELTPRKQGLHGARTKSSGHAEPVTARFPTLK